MKSIPINPPYTKTQSRSIDDTNSDLTRQSDVVDTVNLGGAITKVVEYGL